MTNSEPSQPQNLPGSTTKSGCGSIAMITAVCIYTVILTIGFLVAAAIFWESEFEGLYGSAWLRVAIQGAYAGGLLLLLGPLAIWWKSQPGRRFFRSLCLAAAYALILSFSRIGQVQDAQLAAALQIALTALFLVLLTVIARNRQVDLRLWLKPTSSMHWLIPLLITGVYSLVWLGTGSLGSWLDCLLNLTVGFVFGIACSALLRLGVFTGEALSLESRPSSRWQGFTSSLILAIMLAGMAPNGMQYALMVVIPPLGWLLSLLTTTGTATTGKRSGFPVFLLISLAVAIPFILVDPDELAIATSIGKGGLLYWIILASLVSLVMFGLIYLYLWIGRKNIPHWSFSTTPVVLCALLLVGMITLLILHAGPVFNGERLFVIFKRPGGCQSGSGYRGLRCSPHIRI